MRQIRLNALSLGTTSFGQNPFGRKAFDLQLLLSNGGIHLGINNLVSNEKKQDE
jgi:hypothetical protein